MAKSQADEDYAFGLYPDSSGVMQNKLGLRDAEALKIAEYLITGERTVDAPTFPPTKAGYQALHRHLFEQVYEWAGELRTVDFTKEGSRFASARFLDPMLHTIFANLAQQDFLRGRTGERFAEGAATHINELNLAHAYREGNGRTMRLHLQQLAAQAGHSIDQTRIGKHEWNEASIRGLEGDQQSMARVIAGGLRPARLVTVDVAVTELQAAIDPAISAIKDATRTVRARLGPIPQLGEIIKGYRAELEALTTAGPMAERLADARTAPGRLQVHAPPDASPRETAHALLGAAARLPSSMSVAITEPGAPARPEAETQASYLARTVPSLPSAPVSSPASPEQSRPAPRRSQEPGPGF